MDYERMLDVLLSAEIHEIDILGGEPTFLPILSEMLELNCNGNMITRLSSNRTNPDLLDKIFRKYDTDLVKIGISLNRNTITDQLYRLVMHYKPVVKSVAHRTEFIPSDYDVFLTDPGISYFILFMDAVQPDDLPKCMPFYKFFDHLEKLKSIFPNLEGVYCSGFLPDPQYPILRNVRCPAGTTKLSVMPDGSVYPIFSSGVKNTGLEILWLIN